MLALDYAEIGVTGNPDEYNKVLDLDYQGVVEALKELQNSTGKQLERFIWKHQQLSNIGFSFLPDYVVGRWAE